MSFKVFLIVFFAYLRDNINALVTITLLHYLWNASKIHAIVLITLNLTYLVTKYSVVVLGRDYLNEYYTKISEEKDNGKKG